MSTSSSRGLYVVDTDNDPTSTVDDEDVDHIIMALDFTKKGRLGCAYYNASEETLYCMKDIDDAGQDVVEMLKIDIQPTVLLNSSRFNTHTKMTEVNEYSLHGDQELRPLPYRSELRPSSDFLLESALRALRGLLVSTDCSSTELLVPGEDIEHDGDIVPDQFGYSGQRGELLHIASLLDIDNVVSIGCMGAVLAALNRAKATIYPQQRNVSSHGYCVYKIEPFSLKNTMLLNNDTICALQIMQPESHPNVANQGHGGYGSKESLSIFGLFQHFAKTPQGKAKLRQKFLRPSLDIETIDMRLDFISILTLPQNQSVIVDLSKSLSKVKNIRNATRLLHRGIEGGNHSAGKIRSGVWSSLLDFCYHGIDIAESIRSAAGTGKLSIFADIRQKLDVNLLRQIGRAIDDIVDLEESETHHRTVAKRNVNKDLDRVKDVYNSMEQMLDQVAADIVNSLPGDAVMLNLTVVYLPQLGFYISVPVDHDDYDSSIKNGWQLMFRTEKRVYFKNGQMRLMDEQLGDLYAIICDIEIEIAYDLAQKVLRYEEFLIEASDICGELDSLLALAHGAVQYQLTRPKLVDENIIHIQAGRHLLQERMVRSFVPNDTYIVGGSCATRSPASSTHSDSNEPQKPSMMLLTGPNFSGKSVYMKQVALITYLSQIGSFVPAEVVQIGITDKIFTRITARETVSRSQSSFMIDLQQIALALNSYTCRSLIVIDEFGKGTDTVDGCGLLVGVLQHLLSQGTNSPKVLVSTHLHEILEMGFLNGYTNLSFARMEVMIGKQREDGTANDDAEVCYLYQLQRGRSTLSYGVQCAALHGVSKGVVARAAELSELAIRGEDLVTICSSISATEIQELENAEAVARAFLSCDLDEPGIRELPLRDLLGNILADEGTSGGLALLEEGL